MVKQVMSKIAILTASAFVAIIGATGHALLAEKSFDLKDPKSVNSVSFNIDSNVEPIQGYASGIIGNVKIDPMNPEATTGTVVIDVKTIGSANARLASKMLGTGFLEADKFPTIQFKIVKVTEAKTSKMKDMSVIECKVEGDFTMRNVTKRITVPAIVKWVPEGNQVRQGIPGDILTIKSNFSINRLDFGVDGGLPLELVGNKVDVAFNIAATEIVATK